MALADLTDPGAVRQAISEFRGLGTSAFLRKYGFRPARGWMVLDEDGRPYDAKAVTGAAHGHQHPALGPLKWQDFHGGEASARRLRALGFTVIEPVSRNPAWTRDELILALDLYMRHRPTFPGPQHPEIVELSDLLNRMSAAGGGTSAPTFRNPNGVAMKLQNFRRFDPLEHGRGLPAGGKEEEQVWRVFASEPAYLSRTANAIRAGIGALQPQAPAGDEEEAEEGAILTRLHRYRERDRKMVTRRKAQVLKGAWATRLRGMRLQLRTRVRR